MITQKYNYEVVVNFLHKPDFKATVEAINSCQALSQAVRKAGYPSNTMYSNNSKVKQVS